MADSTALLKIEEGFTSKLPPRKKILCWTPRKAVQVFCVLVILACLNYFGTLPFRWGKPCFIWWEHAATTITFVGATAVRIVLLPVAVLAVLDLNNSDAAGTKWLRVLFHCMLVLAVILALDAFLCIAEVNSVCESEAMRQYQLCASEWGAWDTKAPQHVVDAHKQDGTVHPQLEFECPASCKTDKYDYSFACRCNDGTAWTAQTELDTCRAGTPPRFGGIKYRGGLDATAASDQAAMDEQKSFCETFSTIWDVVVSLLLSGLMVYAAIAINSYRLAVDREGTEMDTQGKDANSN